MSIVPRNAAPVPQWAQQIYGNGEPIAPRSYTATDWNRLGIPPAQLAQWQGNPDTGGQYVYGQAAIPPGFTQASYPSQYGPQWRGAAFGPSGRMGATSNNRATTYYGPGFEPWVDNPDTDLDTPPTLPPWWPKGGDTGGGGIGPPVIPPPDPDKPPVTDPNTDNPATGGGIAPYQSPAPYSTKPSVVTGPDGKAKNPYKWPAKITKGWV